MAIAFTKIKWQNFLSTGSEPIEINLDEYDSTLVVGKNGCGKSTILDALTFALFGRAHRNIKQDQLVNSINGKKLLTEVEFVVKSKNDQHIRIVRGHKPRKFEIYVNGEMLDQHAHTKEQQKFLEQSILKMNHKSFSQIVILGSNTFIPFMQLQRDIRRKVIEDILDIHVFSKMQELAKINQGEILNNMSDLNDAIYDKAIMIGRIRDEIDNLNDILKSQQEQTKERFILQVDSVMNSIESYNAEYLDLDAKISRIIAQNETILSPATDYTPEDLNAQIALKNRFNDALIKLRSSLKRIEKTNQFLNDNENCPTCEQEIDDTFRNTKLQTNQATQGQYEKAIEEAQAHISKVQSEVDKIQDRIEQGRNIRTQLSQMEGQKKQFQSMINNLQGQKDKLQNEIDELDDSVKTGENSISKGINQKKDDIKAIEKEIEALRLEHAKLTEDQHYNAIILEMLHDTGIRTRIIRQYLPAINHFINKFLGLLDLFVSFELDEEFNETIKARHLDKFSYESFSEGQKQRIDLALIFTWREIARMKNTVATNLLILDETLDASLDHNGIENLMQILKYSLGEENNIFVISHKEELLESRFSSKMIFDMKHNFSNVTRIDQSTTVY